MHNSGDCGSSAAGAVPGYRQSFLIRSKKEFYPDPAIQKTDSDLDTKQNINGLETSKLM